MSTVETKYYEAGETTSVVDVNADYAAIAAATTALDSDNVRNEGLGRIHFAPDQGFGPVINYWTFSENASTTGNYSSTSYVLVSHGTAMQVPVNYTLNKGDVLRMQANVDTTTYEIDPANTGAGIFRFQFWWDLGAGYVAVDSMSYPFSALVRPPDVAAESKLNYRRCGFSLVYIHTSNTPITVSGVQVRVKWDEAGNTLTLKQDNMLLIKSAH